jgi:glycerol kinase
MAYLTRDATEAMSAASGHPITALRADGGAAVMDILLQLVADQLRVQVDRPVVQETTALGAAYLAGLACGVWASLDDVANNWALERSFTPAADGDAAYAQWRRALERARGWASP